ncbi:MAG TPA: hypothetical protein DIC41_02790 [Alphaproteobacteria bacterium]|nr:hypothetical protein [Alphaproteobacteria bacterium]HCM07360.1 hypothetical protein [Alphaproteobacteria bacterium]
MNAKGRARLINLSASPQRYSLAFLQGLKSTRALPMCLSQRLFSQQKTANILHPQEGYLRTEP